MAREAWPVLVLVTMLSGGCLGDDGGGEEGDGGGTGGGGDAPGTLGPLNFTGRTTGTDLPGIGTGRCGPTSDCHSFPFSVPAGTSWQVTIELTWETEGMDLDMYLRTEGNDIASATARNPPGTSESIEGRIGPGDFEVLVNGFLAVDEPFRVEITFSEPGPLDA